MNSDRAAWVVVVVGMLAMWVVALTAVINTQ